MKVDLQSRKISFVQEFLSLQNEEIIALFESLLLKEKIRISREYSKPLTEKNLNDRINESLEDSKYDRVTSSVQLIEEVDKWN